MVFRSVIIAALALFWTAGTVSASPFYISTKDVAATDGDVVGVFSLDPVQTQVVIDEDVLSSEAWDMDALDTLPRVGGDLSIVFSASDASTTFGTLTAVDGDLIRYDKASGSFSYFLKESHIFTQTEDIDSVSVLTNGNIVFSTWTQVNAGDWIGGFDFQQGDLIELSGYNVEDGTFGSVAFYGNGDDPIGDVSNLLFPGEEQIDAMDLIGNDLFFSIESSRSAGTWAGGIDITANDLVRYNMTTGEAKIIYTNVEDIDAVAMPIPGAAWLLLSGLLGTAVFSRRRK